MTGTPSKNQARLRRRLRSDRRRARASQRRGILLLVVLSMLVLFMLMGTTFLITSSQYKDASKVIEKSGRTTFQPEDVLERALMQLVRDTNNRHSAARYHSLLRDLYGADGFVGRVFGAPVELAGMPTGDFRPSYAGVQPPATTNLIGSSAGQLVDLYIVDIERTATSNALEKNKVEGIEIGDDGLSIEHSLSQTDSYYNGCLLTMLGGPCRGSSVRVIDYDHISTGNTIDGVPTSPTVTLGRFRVMAPRRLDGRPLSFDGTTSALSDFIEGANLGYKVVVNGRPYNGTGVGFNAFASPNSPQLTALEAVRDITSGDWIGLEIALMPHASMFDPSTASYFDPADPTLVDPFASALTSADFRELNPSGSTALYPFFPGPGGSDESYDAADFQNMFLALQSPQPRVRGQVVELNGGILNSVDPDRYYPAGNGTAPERLDLEDVTIPSFHRPALVNYWLHRQVKRLVEDGHNVQEAALAVLLPYGPDMKRGTSDDPTLPLVARDLIVDIKRKAMMRPLREDHPDFDGSNALSRYDVPSTYVRPKEISDAGGLVHDRGTTTTDDDEITFPYWEAVGPWDVDNDRDGAPDSIWVDMGLPVQTTEDGRRYKPLVAMLVEDLDGRLNLNAHGSTEHLANDGDFVPDRKSDNDDLDVSILIPDPSNPPDLNSLAPANLFGANLAQDYDNNPFLSSSNQLPHGSGWGTADISLRPILSPDLPLYDFLSGTPRTANAQYDDYSRLLVGRPDPSSPIDGNGNLLAPRNVSDPVKTSVTFGRYGSFPGSDPTGAQFYSPGRTFNTSSNLNAANSREERVPFDFPGYPILAGDALSRSGFGQRPDLFSRYSTGLGPSGNLVHEAVADGHLEAASFPFTPRLLLDDSPYELNLSADARRRAMADLDAAKNSYGTQDPLVDDAPFSPAELERLLRAFDFDADKLPDRLWNLVDAFDPQKLAVQDAIIRGWDDPTPPLGIKDPDDMRETGGLWNPNSIERVVAQTKAAINRRQVTTESFDLPVPNENWTARLLLGADGLPGVAFDNPTTAVNEANDDGDVDSSNNDIVNEGDEVGLGVFDPTDGVDFNDSDDYPTVMRWLDVGNTQPPPVTLPTDYLPPPTARLADYMQYRITLELLRKKVIDDSTQPERIARLVSEILIGSNDRDAAFVRTRDTVGASVDAAPINVQSLPVLMSYGGLLTPEVLAGLKMDLNRPFGDGRDNNGNGVVDEPQEAGEPWIDLDGDGVWETGEAYLDLDNDGRFYADANDDGIFFGNAAIDNNDDWFDFDNDGVEEPLVDSVWTQAPGGPYPMDYVRGVDANGRGAYVDSDGDTFHDPTNEPRIHDDGQMARQLYARHLYCLMLAVTDENYIAPFDENDPQVLHYIDSRSGFVDYSLGNTFDPRPQDGSSVAYRLVFELHANEFATEITGGSVSIDPNVSLGAASDPLEVRRLLTHAEARRRAMRKYTIRQIAQWAINTVDMRDPDAIQTPFEYDENPWDGWNVVDRRHNRVYPLDGDLTTNENQTMVRPVTRTTTVTSPIEPTWFVPQREFYASAADPKTFLQVGGVEADYIRRPDGVFIPDNMFATDQSRGVVWGAERPELLMTEGLAIHDRRLSDEGLLEVEGPSTAAANQTELDGGRLVDNDDDFDQRTPPEGSAFVELLNPWSEDDQKPRELYSRQKALDPAAPVYAPYLHDPAIAVPFRYDLTLGIALDRLSNGSAVRLDPARAAYDDPRLEINTTGYRKRPESLPTVANRSTVVPRTIAATSPVWRVICVEEHPDVRNVLQGDDPQSPSSSTSVPAVGAIENGASPTDFLSGDESPWRYRKSFPTGLPVPGSVITDELPSAYVGVATERRRANDLIQIDTDPTVTGAARFILPPDSRDFLQPDPDWPAFDRFARPSAQFGEIAHTVKSDRADTVNAVVKLLLNGTNSDRATPADRIQLVKPDRYIERAFYFIGAPKVSEKGLGVEQRIFRNTVQPGLLIPDLSYQVRGLTSHQKDIKTQLAFDMDPGNSGSLTPQPTEEQKVTVGLELWSDTTPPPGGLFGGSSGGPENIAVNGNRFIITDRYDIDGDANVDESLPLAAIMPGRYAVIGSAGAIYEHENTGIDPTDVDDLVKLANRYTTILSRKIRPGGAANSSTVRDDTKDRLRRVELIPDSNPNRHQVIVRFNGWDRGDRSSEVIDESGVPINLTDPVGSLNSISIGAQIQPVVAIPMEGFSISEPLDGYYFRRQELIEQGQGAKLRVGPSRENPEGDVMQAGLSRPSSVMAGYDQPFDILDELVRDQTTLNYRTLHLQRLANPLLPWNPEPLRPNGEPIAEHDPTRPVNPYRTVDSMPMDLYAYNGAEEPLDPQKEINGRTFATSERGLNPGSSEVIERKVREMTPRDLWRAFSRTLNTVPAIRYDAGGIPNPLPTTHPDVAFFDSVSSSTSGSAKEPYDVEFQHSLGFANRGAGNLIDDTDLGAANIGSGEVFEVDINGDGINGDLVGSLEINAVDDDRTDTQGARDANLRLISPPQADGIPDKYDTIINNQALAALHWPNRPFVSEMELLQVPAWSSSRMLTYYTTYNHQLANQPNPYNGEIILRTDDTIPDVNANGLVDDEDLKLADPRNTNRARWKNQQAPFGHLLNFFQTASGPSRVYPWENPNPTPGALDPLAGVIAYGAPHFYRILDYVHVPSRFIATDTLLNPQVFGQVPALGDVREGFIAPFNRVDSYREPGKVNLNTVVGRGGADNYLNTWSAVYDGLTHRSKDQNTLSGNTLLSMGHLAPAWRDIVTSRRGYVNTSILADGFHDVSSRTLNPYFPTFFANPFRSAGNGNSVPLPSMLLGSVEASMVRSHHFSPGADGAWGVRGREDGFDGVDTVFPPNDVAPNRIDLVDLIRDDAGEAGLSRDTTNNGNGDSYLQAPLSDPNLDDIALFDDGTTPGSIPGRRLAVTDALPSPAAAPTPMFSGASTEPSLNTERNPQLRYGPMTRLANLTTTRSGVFAVWITVGFFEVTPVNKVDHPEIWNRYYDSNDQFLLGMEDVFFRVYQNGRTIGKEIDIDTGENRRHRGFYIIDRTLPVAFQPGDDANVDKAILLRRRIE